MHLQENTLFDLDHGVKVTWNITQLSLHNVTYMYASAKFGVAAPNRLGDVLQENTLFDIDPVVTQNIASTSCDLCNCKIWSGYIQRFRRICIYKKIYYLTFYLDLRVEVTRNLVHYPIHHMTYAPAKFKVATAHSLAGDNKKNLKL